MHPMLDAGNRQRFIDLAGRHHVLGLALTTLLPELEATTPWRAVREEWSRRVKERRRRAAMFEFKRDKALTDLGAAGIQAIALKGTALRATVYRDPVEREQDDLDLLVAKSEAARAAEVMQSAGYFFPASAEMVDAYWKHHFHFHLRSGDGHIVEIHWALLKPGQPFDVSTDDVRDHAVEVRLADGTKMLVPSPPHLVVQIILQNLQESFSRLGRVVDIDRIVTADSGFDWDELIRVARLGSLQSAVAVSLQLSRKLLGTPVSEEVLRDLCPSPAARFHLAIMSPEDCLMGQKLRRTHSGAGLFELWLVRPVRQRMQQLARRLREGKFTEITRERRPWPGRRVLRLIKLCGVQLLVYGAALRFVVAPLRGGRPWFWSGQSDLPGGTPIPDIPARFTASGDETKKGDRS